MDEGPAQFSLRSLFLLTAVVALMTWLALAAPFALIVGVFLASFGFGLIIACLSAVVAIVGRFSE